MEKQFKLNLLIITAFLSVSIFPIASYGFECTRESGDYKTCYFSNIRDSFSFYKDLSGMYDANKGTVTKIYFRNCDLLNIPKELTSIYYNIENLDASNIRLARISEIDFNPSNKILYLNVSSNVLASLIKNGLPSMMTRLISLDMSHNVIDRVDDDVFSSNSNLKYLNLSHNRIGKVGMEFFNSAKKLEILNLDNNRISHISWHSGGVQSNLKELHLQNNELKAFYPPMIPSASYLDLSHNNLGENLDLSENNLLVLKVSNNLLQSLKINNNLEALDASSNEDKSFELDFNGNKVLKSLSLSNLNIPSYKKILNDIQQRSNLTLLDLSKNTLNTFDFYDAKLPQSLEILDISRCEIHSLTSWENLKKFLPNLTSLDIRGNYLHCDDMKRIVNNFKDENFLAGFNETEVDEYVSKNCASDHHRHKELKKQKVYEAMQTQNKFLWAIMIIMMLGYVFGGLYYVNRRYNFVHCFKRTSQDSNGFVRHEFTNSA